MEPRLRSITNRKFTAILTILAIALSVTLLLGVEKIRTIGDNYMVVAGVPTPRPDHAPALARLAVEEFRHCTGFDARPLSVEHERMPAWDISWSALQGLSLPSGLRVAANWWSRPGLPGRLAEAERTARALTGAPVRDEAHA